MRIAKPQGPNLKTPRYESEAYRRHVAKCPCMACGAVVLTDEGFMSQCAHIGILGRSMKNHDFYTLPLCPAHGMTAGCHYLFDQGQKEFAEHVWRMSIYKLKAVRFVVWLEWQINQIWKGQK